MNEIKDEIPNILTSLLMLLLMVKLMRLKVKKTLATTTALITVENKIPNICNLIKKTKYNIKTIEIGIETIVLH